jgi:putative ABC transport system permease protein
MIKILNISKSYKSRQGLISEAVKNVSLSFGDKGMVFLTGKSGSGKTTLLNLIGGMDRADSGEIIVNNKSFKDFKSSDYDAYRNKYIGFVFQDFLLLEDYSIKENIGLAFELQRKEFSDKEIDDILDKVGLSGLKDRKPYELSGGQKQRVAIARALIKDPEIILSDEPTGNLDSATGEEIFKLLKELSRERPVIVVSHDNESARNYGDRIINLSDGVVESDYINAPDIPLNKVTVIGGKIYLPDRKLTPSEIKQINKALSGGAKLSRRPQAKSVEVDDNKTFIKTKNRLPKKTALRLGAAGLKQRPKRAIMTIVLMVLAFTLISMESVMLFYDDNRAMANILDITDTEYVLFRNGKANAEGLLMKSYYHYLPIEDYTAIKEEYNDLNISPIYRINDRFAYKRNGDVIERDIAGLIVLPQESLDLLGYSILYGDYPASGSGKIAICDFVADGMIDNDIYSSYADIISKGYIYRGYYCYPVSGIINTRYKERYANTYFNEQINSEEADKFIFELYNYFGLFFTSDIESANKIFNDRGEVVRYAEYINLEYSVREKEIGGKKLTEKVLTDEKTTVNYMTEGVNKEDIVLHDNEVLIDSFLSYELNNNRKMDFPHNISIDGKELVVVGTFSNPDYYNIILTSEAVYEDFAVVSNGLCGIFSNIYDSKAKNKAFFEDLYGRGIIHDTYYSVIVTEVNYLIYFLKYVLLGVAGFFLIYAVIMLFNFISISVNSRSRDIGILRAMGATAGDISAVYLVEALTIGVFSALMSYPMIIGTTHLLNSVLMNISYSFKTTIIPIFSLDIITMGIMIGLGIFSASAGALLPVFRLSRIKPVEAIRKV